MAVTITTKFYEEDTPAWHDLSKVVFTSPNMTSPQTVGTRSHILPGQDDLGLWYEDSSNMYKIESIQDTYDTSFYYYYGSLDSPFDLDGAMPSVASIGGTNHPNIVDFIKDASSVEVTGFASKSADIENTTLKLEYTVVTNARWPLESIDVSDSTYYDDLYADFTCTTSIEHQYETHEWDYTQRRKISEDKWAKGWQADVIPDIQECYIDFEFSLPTKITYINMSAQWKRTDTWDEECEYIDWEQSETQGAYTYFFIGNFKIQGKTDTPGATWQDLYTGSNTTNINKDIFMLDNTNYYTFYRILISNNDSLTTPDAGGTFDTDKYAISGLVFKGNDYSTDPGTDYLIMYDFDEDDVGRELHVTNAFPEGGTPFNTLFDDTISVEGTVFITPVSGTEGQGELTNYAIKADNALNYRTSAEGLSTTVSGLTGLETCVGVTEIRQDDSVLAGGYMDVTGQAGLTGMAFSCVIDGTQTGLSYSNSLYDIVTEITYTTTLSGVLPEPGYQGEVVIEGTTRRQEDRDSTPRAASYDLTVSDVTSSGIISSSTNLYVWGFRADLTDVDFSTTDSVTFEVTSGEAYNCRLTAWDDSSHSTILNDVIAGDHCKVSALAFRSEGTVLAPEYSLTPDNYIMSPIHNRTFKGNVVFGGTNYYYGDFNLTHRTETDMIGDYLIFKPLLYDIPISFPYGVHDFVITLHYSYT